MDADSKDLLCKQIIDGIDALTELIGTGAGERLLGVDEEAEPKERLKELSLLRESLDQYLSRQRGLLYVGLIGHFSSGKSSTINSVLELWNTEDCRATDQNPTDHLVTVITHPNNSASLTALARRGHVSIATQVAASPLLEGMAIIDTPGSGDPSVLDPILKDILPLCDILLFVLSGTSPLDISDVPILQRQYSALPFIPTKFIVTRADEFRSEYERVLSEENYNEISASEFITTLIARIREAVPGIEITPKDFFILDNKAKFRIKPLQNHLKNSANDTDSRQVIALHENKFAYFLRYAREYQAYYLGLARNRLSSLQEVFGNARENKEKFAQTVRFDASIPAHWSRVRIEIQEIAQESLRKVGKPLNPIELPDTLLEHPESISWRQEIFDSMQGEANKRARALLLSLKGLGRLRAQEFKSNIINALDQDDALEIDLEARFPINRSLEDLIPSFDLELPTAIQKSFSLFKRVVQNILESTKKDLEGNHRSLAERLRIGQPLSEIIRICNETISTLERDVEACCNKADAYVNGVVAYRNLPLLRKLDIPSLRANLAQISPENQDEIKKEALDVAFQGFGQIEVEATDKFNELRSRVADSQSAIPNINRSKGTSVSCKPSKEEEQRSKIMTVLQQEAQIFNEWQKKVLALLTAEISTQGNSYKGSQLARRKALGRKAVGLTLAACFALALYVAGSFFSSIPEPNTMFGVILAGLVATALYGSTKTIWKRLRHSFERVEAYSRRDHIRELWAASGKILDDVVPPSNTSQEAEDTLKSEILFCWNEGLHEALNEEADGTSKEIYDNLKEAESRWEQIRDDYLECISWVAEQADAYFGAIDETLEGLELIARKIEEMAIRPSFDDLMELESHLKKLRISIEKVSFT